MTYDIWKLNDSLVTWGEWLPKPNLLEKNDTQKQEDMKQRVINHLKENVPETNLLAREALDEQAQAIAKQIIDNNAKYGMKPLLFQGERDTKIKESFELLEEALFKDIESAKYEHHDKISLIEKSCKNTHLTDSEKESLDITLSQPVFWEYFVATSQGRDIAIHASEMIDAKWKKSEELWLSSSDIELLQIGYMRVLSIENDDSRDKAIENLELMYSFFLKESLWLDDKDKHQLKQMFYKDILSAPYTEWSDNFSALEGKWKVPIEVKKAEKNNSFNNLKEKVSVLQEISTGIDFNSYLEAAAKEVYSNLSKGWPPNCSVAISNFNYDLYNKGLADKIEQTQTANKKVDILVDDDAKLNSIGAIHRAAASTATEISMRHYFDISYNLVIGLEQIKDVKVKYLEKLEEDIQKIESDIRKIESEISEPESGTEFLADKKKAKIEEIIKEIEDKKKEVEQIKAICYDYSETISKLKDYLGLSVDFDASEDAYEQTRLKFIDEAKEEQSHLTSSPPPLGGEFISKRHLELSKRLTLLKSRLGDAKGKRNKKLINRIENEIEFLVLELNLEKQKSIFSNISGIYEERILSSINKENMSIYEVEFWSSLQQSLQSVKKINAASIIARTLTEKSEHYSHRDTNYFSRSQASALSGITKEEVSKKIISIFNSATEGTIERLQNSTEVLANIPLEQQANEQNKIDTSNSAPLSIFSKTIKTILAGSSTPSDADNVFQHLNINLAKEIIEPSSLLVDAFRPISTNPNLSAKERKCFTALDLHTKKLKSLVEKVALLDDMKHTNDNDKQSQERNKELNIERNKVIEEIASLSDKTIKLNTSIQQIMLESDNISLRGAFSTYNGIIDNVSFIRNTSSTIEKAYDTYINKDEADENKANSVLGFLQKKAAILSIDTNVEKNLSCSKSIFKQYLQRVPKSNIVIPKSAPVKKPSLLTLSVPAPTSLSFFESPDNKNSQDVSPIKYKKRNRLALLSAATKACRIMSTGKVSINGDANDIKINDFNNIIEVFHNAYQMNQASTRFDMFMESSRLLSTLDNDLESLSSRFVMSNFNVIDDKTKLFGRYEAAGSLTEQLSMLELKIGTQHSIPDALIERLKSESPSIDDKIKFQYLLRKR